MTTGTALATLTLSLTCALAVTATANQKRKPAAPAASAGVEELYTANCERCHGNGSSETKELNFADGEWRHGSSEADVVKTITEGVPGTAMLPWKERFTPEEIVALARYVRSLDKSLAPAKSKSRGRGK